MILSVFVACGPIEPVGVDDSAIRIRALVSQDGEALNLGETLLDLGDGLEVYAALIRIEKMTFRGEYEDVDKSFELHSAVNIDLFSGNTVAQPILEFSKIDEIELQIQPGAGGEGVLRGEPAAVFIGGLIDDIPFEYRAKSLGPVIIHTDIKPKASADAEIELLFELGDWLAELSNDSLSEIDGMILIDDENNSEIAADLDNDVEDASDAHYDDESSGHDIDSDFENESESKEKPKSSGDE